MDKVKVFIVCSGLGNTQRGFESFTQECFDALSQVSELDITLFKGGGESTASQITLWNFPRDSRLGTYLSKLTKRGSYYIEQLSFTLSLLPYIYREQPDIIYFSDITIGNALWHWRKNTRQSYKLVLSNGGPFSAPFDRWDRIQQVAPSHLQAALQAGEPIEKQILVPYGIKMDSQLNMLSASEKTRLRCKLGLPEDLPIVLSVAAINKYHKRIDYLIREISRLPKPHPYLLILGQMESESSEIIELANQLLEADNFKFTTVASHQISEYYQVANIFVLASLTEGFGRVFLEAMSYGLPCLAHDYEVSRFVLKDEGYFADFRISNNLANLIQQALTQDNEDAKYRRYQSIYERFSWESLRAAHVDMFCEVI